MNSDKLNEACCEAQRFLRRVAELIEAEGKRKRNNYHYSCPKQSGAVRRASLDLTRALAELRKP
jgi:hypothetical protein